MKKPELAMSNEQLTITIAVLKKVRYAQCPMPSLPNAPCPMPYALCPMPHARRVPHVTEKGYNYQGLPIIVKAAQ